MRKVCCAGTRPSWTAASPPQKKGPCRRQNQAGQGHEVDGTGRRSRSSAGSSAGKCLSGRSYACGSHARRSLRPTPARTATAKAPARDRRPRLRLRPAPQTAAKTWHRTDRALPEEQPASEIRRWPQAAPLSATLDRRANQCLAWSIPQVVGPTRASAFHLSRLLLPCLLLDYPEALFMKHALDPRCAGCEWIRLRRMMLKPPHFTNHRTVGTAPSGRCAACWARPAIGNSSVKFRG